MDIVFSREILERLWGQRQGPDVNQRRRLIFRNFLEENQQNVAERGSLLK